ncbi:MAG: DUF11 domain-containing protein [Acidobacteria bacterium]|nr:DUF11 domain-containing protein [Acidobacteriota bacterium]
MAIWGTTAPSNTVVITIVVSIPANFPTGNLANTAVVSSTSNDSNPGNNSSTVTVPVINSDVRIVKTASKTSSRPGDDLTYTLTVTNLGPSDATGVTVTDNLAAGLSLTNVSSTLGTCSGTQNITCNIGNMGTTAPSNTAVITIVVSIPANFPTGNLANTAVVSSTSNDSNPGNNSSTVTVPLVNSDVRIVKTASKTTSRPGDDLTYTLTVTNLGPSDATGVTVTDNLAAGLSLTNVSSTQGTCSGTQNITCNIGNMGTTAPTNTVVITIVVSIPANFPTGNLANTAVVSSTSNDSTPGNNSSTVTVPVINSDVRIVKTASRTTSRPGDDLTYTLTVTNLGPSDATGVTVTDNLAAGLSLTNVSSTQGTCSGTQNITCNIGNMGTTAPSNTVIITIAVKIDANFQGVTAANTAVVSSTSNDSTPGNNSSTVTIPVINSDVRIVKTASKSSLMAGEDLTYTLTVTNLGPSDAIGVKVNDELPPGLTLRSITTSKGSCSGTQSIACDIGDLTSSAPSNTATITISVTVPTSFSAGSLANTAVVSSTSNDSNPGNNSSTVNTPVARNSDVRISKATSKNVVRAGDDLTFMLTVTNLGPSDAIGVTVTDTLPAGLTVRNITTNRGTCSGTQTITCNIGDLTTTAPSNSATITIAVNVPTSFPLGTMTNTAVVSSTSPDSNSGNNTSSVNVTVNPPPSANFRTVDVTIRNSPLDICVDSGTVINVEVRLTNTGDGVQQNNPGPEFIAMLPVQLTAINNSCSATGGSCSVTSNQIEWNGTVAVGQTIRINYQVKVKSGITVGTRMCTDFVINYDTNSDGANDATTMLNNCITANCAPPPCEGDNCGPTIGTPFPPETPSSDLKPGSILIFPIYTSDPSIGSRQNTRINLTNTDQLRPAFVHLFFVDGTTCSVADNYICLTPNQTTSFLASDLDPGVTGYIIAVAVDSLGYPASFNYLIGDSYIKLSSGHSANLAAESVWALNIPAWNLTSSTATINLNGTQYSQLGRVVAADNLPSTEDGNSTLLILDRIGGDMTNVADNIGSIFGLVYNDVENSFSFTTTQQSCQIRLPLSSSFPRSTPRYNQIIPAGRTGWIKFTLQNEGALIGATINNTVNPNGFRGGHSLHKITLGTTSLTIPIVIPPCQ